MKIEQLVIMFTSVIAVFLTQQQWNPEWGKWACVFGMVSQPFWLMSSYRTKQWGIFASAIIYTFVWGLGLYNNFWL